MANISNPDYSQVGTVTHYYAIKCCSNHTLLHCESLETHLNQCMNSKVNVTSGGYQVRGKHLFSLKRKYCWRRVIPQQESYIRGWEEAKIHLLLLKHMLFLSVNSFIRAFSSISKRDNLAKKRAV